MKYYQHFIKHIVYLKKASGYITIQLKPIQPTKRQ